MADGTLRALERRCRETGDLDDEARYLAERLRCGLVTERGLVIAAGLGHTGALRVAPAVGLTALELVELPRPPGRRHPLDLARARAAVAVGAAMSRGDPPAGDPSSVAYRGCLIAAVAWTLCPCDRHARLLGARQLDEPCPGPCCGRDHWVHHALRVVRVLAEVERPAEEWPWLGEDARGPAARLADDRPELAEQAQRAVAAALLPWALGERDPLQAG